jgi:glycine cleavage system H protein
MASCAVNPRLSPLQRCLSWRPTSSAETKKQARLFKGKVDMKYTEEHEWLQAEGEIITVGITAHAAEQLGDVVFVELPEVGSEVTKDEEIVVIESVKAASDILSPLDGEIVEINEAIADEPGKVNEDPEGEAWFFKIKPSDLSPMDDYMDEAGYKAFIG